MSTVLKCVQNDCKRRLTEIKKKIQEWSMVSSVQRYKKLETQNGADSAVGGGLPTIAHMREITVS